MSSEFFAPRRKGAKLESHPDVGRGRRRAEESGQRTEGGGRRRNGRESGSQVVRMWGSGNQGTRKGKWLK